MDKVTNQWIYLYQNLEMEDSSKAIKTTEFYNQSTECTDGEAMRECFRLIVSFLFA
jgi:hypothetical protein